MQRRKAGVRKACDGGRGGRKGRRWWENFGFMRIDPLGGAGGPMGGKHARSEMGECLKWKGQVNRSRSLVTTMILSRQKSMSCLNNGTG